VDPNELLLELARIFIRILLVYAQNLI